jgi:uroporphyrinogen decarboxylase
MLIPHDIRAQRAPDWRRLLSALRRESEPERVPFYELFVEETMVSRIMERPYSIAAEVELFYNLCHDYVNFTPDSGLLQSDSLLLDDTGANNVGGKREWANSNDGVLSHREALAGYPWRKPGTWCCERYDEYARLLPEGMGIVIRPLGVFENVRRLVGLVPLSYALFDDEPFAAEVFERAGEAIYGSLKATFDHVDLSKAFAVIMGDDLAAGCNTIMSPDVYRKYVFPWMKKAADLAHAHDMPFGLHSCGNNETIMEELIEDVGIDAKHSFQDNVIPVQDFKRKYGRRLAVLGGIDMHKLSTLSALEFRPYCEEVLTDCRTGGGYALGTGNSPATYIRLENFFMMHRIGLGIV